MFKINDYIMYKREVCKVVSLKEKYYKDNDYYELIPISDESLKIVVPIDNKSLKPLMTKEEIETLINKIPFIKEIECDTRTIENEYKAKISSQKYEDLISIIKTTYLRNKERQDNHKKIGDIDNYYFTKAENYLYQEIAIVLNKSVDEVREYINTKVSNLVVE